jgi:hypothetical protein
MALALWSVGVNGKRFEDWRNDILKRESCAGRAHRNHARKHFWPYVA